MCGHNFTIGFEVNTLQIYMVVSITVSFWITLMFYTKGKGNVEGHSFCGMGNQSFQCYLWGFQIKDGLPLYKNK
jgi:hypothetical protein